MASAAINWLAWFGPISSIVGALFSSAATGGAAGTSGGYSVGVKMNIENWTKYQLHNYAATTVSGYVQNYPVFVNEGERKILRAHKSGGTARGSVGVVSYEIANLNRRIAIMWSAPYNFNFHYTWLAVGLTDPGYTTFTPLWYNDMYNKAGTGYFGLKFKRKRYYANTSQLLFDDRRFQIVASMGTSHHPEINIYLRPKEWSDISPTILAEINNRRG